MLISRWARRCYLQVLAVSRRRSERWDLSAVPSSFSYGISSGGAALNVPAIPCLRHYRVSRLECILHMFSPLCLSLSSSQGSSTPHTTSRSPQSRSALSPLKFAIKHLSDDLQATRCSFASFRSSFPRSECYALPDTVLTLDKWRGIEDDKHDLLTSELKLAGRYNW